MNHQLLDGVFARMVASAVTYRDLTLLVGRPPLDDAADDVAPRMDRLRSAMESIEPRLAAEDDAALRRQVRKQVEQWVQRAEAAGAPPTDHLTDVLHLAAELAPRALLCVCDYYLDDWRWYRPVFLLSAPDGEEWMEFYASHNRFHVLRVQKPHYEASFDVVEYDAAPLRTHDRPLVMP